MPLLADTTAGALYPGNAPFLFADPDSARPGEDSPVFRALDQVASINAVLGGVFMYVFLRTLSLAPLASTFGALVFACCGTMGWFAAWYMQIQSSVVWLPLILAAIHRASRDAPAWWTSIGAVAVALQFFAGFPETSFYSGVIAIAYAAHLAISRRSPRPIAYTGMIYVAGCFLAAIQLLPSLELQSMSRRPGELSLEVFQSMPASFAMFRSWLVPSASAGFDFPPPGSYYFGAIAPLAAFVGVVSHPRNSVFYLTLLVLGVALSLGEATPLSALLHELPVFNAFRHPFKHMFEVAFAMSVLAGFGAQWVAGHREGSASPMRLGLVGLATVATCILLRANHAEVAAGNPANTDTSGARPSIARELEPGWRVLTPRQVFQTRSAELLIGDYPSQFELAAVHGAGPFLWSAMADATGMIEEETKFRPGLFGAADRTLALLSGRYLIQTRLKNRFWPAVDDAAWSLVAETGEWRLVERRDALPFARFVAAVRCGQDADIAASLHGAGPDPGQVAMLDCSKQPAPDGPFSPSATLSVQVNTTRAGTLDFATAVPGNSSAFLVLSQPDFPGWHASVDGTRIPIRRVHGLVQGIALPPGASRVEMHYLPTSFVTGAALSTATLIVMLLWNFVERLPTLAEPDGGSTTRAAAHEP